MKLVLYLVRTFFAVKAEITLVFFNPINSKVLATIGKNIGDTLFSDPV